MTTENDYWQYKINNEARLANQYYDIMTEYLTAPSILYKPRVFMDGSRWCAFFGENPENGVAGFGNSPKEAFTDFDRNWKTKSPENKVTQTKAYCTCGMSLRITQHGKDGVHFEPCRTCTKKKKYEMSIVKRSVCRLIWWLSESLHIPLGNLAPRIFNGMMGQKGRKIR